MSSNIAWRGAVEFSGFPVNVALYSRVKKTRNQSFRNIAPSGQPVKAQQIDPADGKPVDNEQIRKGYETAKGVFAIMTPEALDQINAGVKTALAKPAGFAPLESIAFDLAIDRFAVRPDDKVPGADQAANVMWNGLRDSRLAYTTQVSLSGGADAILVLYADERGFWGALLPFERELYDVPTHEFKTDEKASALFAQVVDQQYEVGDFDHSSFTSEYSERRLAAIQSVIDNKPVEVSGRPDTQTSAPDLMAVLAASVAQAKAKTKPKTTRKKVAA
jgi:non-homologous end joining protein Ku